MSEGGVLRFAFGEEKGYKMKKLLLFVLLVFFSSCTEESKSVDCSPDNYSCTSEQMAMVEKELLICSKTSYFNSYCFCQAKKTICRNMFDSSKPLIDIKVE